MNNKNYSDEYLKSVKHEVHEKEMFLDFMNPVDRSEVDMEMGGVTNELAKIDKEVRNHYKKL